MTVDYTPFSGPDEEEDEEFVVAVPEGGEEDDVLVYSIVSPEEGYKLLEEDE
jgi:hypothetical protein